MALFDAATWERALSTPLLGNRAGDWLQERLQNLRDQAAAAERAVVQFKAKNGMVSAGGTLISDQQLGAITGDLGKARAYAADLQARLERARRGVSLPRP